MLFLFRELRHVLLRHGAHGRELGADLVDLVALESMLLANLLDLLVAQHATSLGLVLFRFTRWLPGCCTCLFAIFLFDLECGPSSPVLCERIRCCLTIGQT